MNEVSCRVYDFFLEVERRHDISVATILDGLPLSADTLRDPTQRFDWDVFCELLARVDRLLPAHVSFERLGTYLSMNTMTGPLRAIAAPFGDVRLAYRAAFTWFGPSLTRGPRSTYRDLGGRRVRIEIEIPAAYRESMQFLRLCSGAATSLPRMFGLPDAVVTAELAPRRGSFAITVPEAPSFLARLRKLPAAFFAARATIAELAAQQHQLRDGYEALLRSQRDLHTALATLPDGIVIERAGRILYANPAFAASLGVAHPRGLHGRTLADAVIEGDREPLRALLAGGAATELHLVAGPVLVTVEASPAQQIEFQGGSAQLLVFRDLTARRDTEVALRRSEDENRALLAAIPDLILRVDGNGKILDVHAGMLRRSEVLPRRLIGLNVRDLNAVSPGLAPGSVDEGVAAIRTALATGTTQIVESRVTPVGGAATTWESRFVPLGAPLGTEVLVIARDVTERSQAQTGLALADRMVSVGTLAAGVAHEINNPLTYVIANLRALARRVKRVAGGQPLAAGELPDLEQMLGDALDGAERVRDIVADLKTFSRGDDEESGPVDVRVVLDAAIKMAQNEIRHRARLTRDYTPVPPVRATSARLGQVFLNLLLNAAQAIPEGHADANQITVRVRATGGWIAVEISDTGAGIAPELVGRIFDPFFTTKPAVGTGLGLAICHKIVSALGGDIAVESAPGQGATFRLRLPAADAPLVDRRFERTAAERSAIPRARVLIVDDEPRVAEALAGALDGHDVQLAASGREALSRLVGEGPPFDVVFCDLLMPEMSGMDLYDALVAQRPAVAPRVVFMTAGAFTPRAREFLAGVSNHCIEKPFDMEAVLSLVAAAARRPTAV